MDLVPRKYSTISIPLPPLNSGVCGRLQWCRGLMTDGRYGSAWYASPGAGEAKRCSRAKLSKG